MKRFRLAALILALVILLTLTGCGGAQSETEAPTEVNTDDGENALLFENDACAYRLVKSTENALGDFVWQVELVNKTAQTLVFSMDHVYVNDCKLDPYWATEVTAGQTVQSEVSWARSAVDACELTAFVRVDFVLTVYPSGSYGNNLAETQITAYPQGEDAYFAEMRPDHPTDVTLLETEEYTVIATGLETEGEQGCTMSLYLLNKSGRDVLFRLDNARINGQYFDPGWLSSLAGGKRSFETVSWQAADLKAKEITQITELSFDVTVCSADGSRVLRQEHATLNP